MNGIFFNFSVNREGSGCGAVGSALATTLRDLVRLPTAQKPMYGIHS